MNILLVEDDIDSRIALAKFLRHLGHYVKEAENGLDALSIFGESNFHMVLADIKMPKMSGIELLKKISSTYRNREVVVVLFTGHGDLESAIEALRAGAYDYLLKPINIKELAVLLGRIAEQLYLKEENSLLAERFDGALKAASETKKELERIKKTYTGEIGTGEIGIFSESMKRIFQQAEKFHGDRSIPVFIQGETGTGKEVVARFIHYGRDAVHAPFVDINCAAIPSNIFESELFGYEAGAFTGGLQKGRKGKMDLADGGTLFLDEISEMPLECQAKLLRVVQDKEYYRVGGLKKIKTDIRIICAANTDIDKKIREGRFRQDLFYRLNAGRIILPPLRERREEILPLAEMFLKRFASQKGKKFDKISDKAAGILRSHHWPGNVRELMNVIEYIVFMHDDETLEVEHLEELPQFQTRVFDKERGGNPVNFENCPLPPGGLDLKRLNDMIILRALKKHNGNITKTAAYLGISRRVLQYRLKRIKG